MYRKFKFSVIFVIFCHICDICHILEMGGFAPKRIHYHTIIWFRLLKFIIYPCDTTVVIFYLIWPCDTTICSTYLVSHSYSLTYILRIFQFGCIINTKLPSCDDIIHRTSLGFPSWCPESTSPTDSCFQAPAVKTS